MGLNSVAVEATVVVAHRPQAVFEFIADHRNALTFMHNIRRFEPTSKRDYGLGSSFYWETEIRGFRLGWEFVVSEFRPYELMAARSICAPYSESIWYFRPVRRGTLASFGVSCALPSLAVHVGRWLIKRELAANVEKSLAKLAVQLEKRCLV